MVRVTVMLMLRVTVTEIVTVTVTVQDLSDFANRCDQLRMPISVLQRTPQQPTYGDDEGGIKDLLLLLSTLQERRGEGVQTLHLPAGNSVITVQLSGKCDVNVVQLEEPPSRTRGASRPRRSSRRHLR